MEDDFDNFDDITKIETYAQFLDRFVTDEDRMYLEDEELARNVKELYAVNKGEIRSEADFLRKKKELEEMNKEEEKTDEDLSSTMNYIKGSFLRLLQERESQVKNGKKSTIIFIRYKDKKGKETSAYIDYRERLKNHNEMKEVFQEGKPLIPKPTDLSYYNWTLQKVVSNDSTFFRVDAGPKERLSFKNNTDRKIINVDLEYIEKHPGIDVKRIPINIKNRDGTKDIIREGQINKPKITVTPVDVKKENKTLRKKEENENDNWGYQQIVIFDYETRSK